MSQHFILRRTADGAETPVTEDLIAGRLPGSGLLLPEGGADGGPSRRHAQISVSDGSLWVEDLESKNGTFVNGTRLPVRTRTQLRPGDRVRFDQVEFVVQAPQDDGDVTMVRMPPTQARPAPVPPAPPAAPPRAAPAPPAAPAQKAAAPATSPEPAPRAAAAAPPRAAVAPASPAGPGERPPGSWADPEAQGDSKTVFIDPARVKEMLQKPRSVGRQSPGQVSVPTLSILSGTLKGGRFELRGQSGQSNEWTVGSNPDRNIVLRDDGVSGEHARIVNDGERWKIIDQLSRNGTFVNGKRTNTSYLTSGDEVRVGPAVTCVFQLPGQPTRRSAPVAAPEKPTRRGSRIDLTTLLISFLVTAAVILIIWRYLPALRAHAP